MAGADGAYRFSDLPSGVYRVSLQLSSLPGDVAGPETSYVLTLDADFVCETVVGGTALWWFIGGGAGVLFLGLAMLAGWLFYRRRGEEEPVEAEPILEDLRV